MEINPIEKDLKMYLKKHQLENKWSKAIDLFQNNHLHPSLKFELFAGHLVCQFAPCGSLLLFVKNG